MYEIEIQPVWKLCFLSFLTMLHGLQDLNSPTRDQTQARVWKHGVPTTGPSGNSLETFLEGYVPVTLSSSRILQICWLKKWMNKGMPSWFCLLTNPQYWVFISAWLYWEHRPSSIETERERLTSATLDCPFSEDILILKASRIYRSNESEEMTTSSRSRPGSWNFEASNSGRSIIRWFNTVLGK